MCTAISGTPKPGNTVIIDEKSFRVIKEKGELIYLVPEEGEKQHIFILLNKSKKLIETKVKAEAFRAPGKSLKEIEMSGDDILIFGVKFTRVGKSSCVAESLTIQVQYEEAIVSLRMRFSSLSLESVTA